LLTNINGLLTGVGTLVTQLLNDLITTTPENSPTPTTANSQSQQK
jgi:hypothetical protein